MTLIEMPNLVQGTDEWLAARLGIPTASVMGGLLATRTLSAIDYDCPECGARAEFPCVSVAKGRSGPIKTVHAGRTAVSVANRATSPVIVEAADNDTSRALTTLLVSERITGWTEPVWVNADMERGNRDEPIARELYSEHYADVTEMGFMVWQEGHCRIGYSPDGLVGDDGLIEVKSRRPKTQVATVFAGEVPLENMAQIQCGLLVSGRKWLDYVSFAGGLALWTKRVYPDPKWFDAILAAVEQFEATAAEMVATYNERTAGLPMTERVLDLEMIVI